MKEVKRVCDSVDGNKNPKKKEETTKNNGGYSKFGYNFNEYSQESEEE